MAKKKDLVPKKAKKVNVEDEISHFPNNIRSNGMMPRIVCSTTRRGSGRRPLH